MLAHSCVECFLVRRPAACASKQTLLKTNLEES